MMYQYVSNDGRGSYVNLASLQVSNPSEAMQTCQATTFAVHPAHAEVEGNLNGSQPFPPGSCSP